MLTPLLYIFPQNEYLFQSSVTWPTATAPNVISMQMLVKSLSFSPSQSFPPSLPCFYVSIISAFFLSGRYLGLNVIPNTARIDYPLSETSLPPGFFTVIIVSPIFVRHPVSTLECLGFLFFYYLLHVVGNKISSFFNLSSKCLIMSILTGNIFIQIFINFIFSIHQVS